MRGKTQAIRVLDVIWIGPTMVYASWLLAPQHRFLRRSLAAMGIATVLYNGHNFVRIANQRRAIE